MVIKVVPKIHDDDSQKITDQISVYNHGSPKLKGPVLIYNHDSLKKLKKNHNLKTTSSLLVSSKP
jgi:hypothetical protein